MCLLKSRNKWMSTYLYCKSKGIPCIFLHQNIYWDGLQPFKKRWKSMVFFAATLGEFNHNQLSNVELPTILPITICNKDDISENDGEGKKFSYETMSKIIVSELEPFSRGVMYDIGLCPEASVDGKIMVFMFNTMLRGDTPARGNGLGAFESGHCLSCGCRSKNYPESILIPESNPCSCRDDVWQENFINEYESAKLIGEEQSWLSDRKLHHFSAYYKLIGSPISYQLGLDYMHMVCGGSVKGICFSFNFLLNCYIVVFDHLFVKLAVLEPAIAEIFSNRIQKCGSFNGGTSIPTFNDVPHWFTSLNTHSKYKSFLHIVALLHDYIIQLEDGELILQYLRDYLDTLRTVGKRAFTASELLRFGNLCWKSEVRGFELFGAGFINKKINSHALYLYILQNL